MYLAVLVIVAGAGVFIRRFQWRVAARQHAVLSALFLFPVVHYTVLCALSDWTVWPWYYYSLCYALLAATAVLLVGATRERVRASSIALSVAGLALGVYVISYAVLKRPRTMLGHVAEYARKHPGTYAMGDGAGTPAFFGESPFVQMEGLTMDAEYLAFLRAHEALPDVLRHYHADYYVSFRGAPDGPCLLFNEPQQGGPRSPKLQGRVCTPPLDGIVEDGVEVDVYRVADVLPR